LGVKTRNDFVRLQENIDNSWSQVENQMQRRYDLIPNLVNTVKGVAGQEQKVFLGIAEARAKLAGARTQSDKIQASTQMESALSRLLVVVEQYPQLRSSDSFNRLMDELAGTENRLSVERKRYNDMVTEYNKGLRMFPKSVIASLLHYEKRARFEIQQEAKKNINVSF
jgi:LemA protein